MARPSGTPTRSGVTLTPDPRSATGSAFEGAGRSGAPPRVIHAVTATAIATPKITHVVFM